MVRFINMVWRVKNQGEKNSMGLIPVNHHGRLWDPKNGKKKIRLRKNVSSRIDEENSVEDLEILGKNCLGLWNTKKFFLVWEWSRKNSINFHTGFFFFK